MTDSLFPSSPSSPVPVPLNTWCIPRKFISTGNYDYSPQYTISINNLLITIIRDEIVPGNNHTWFVYIHSNSYPSLWYTQNDELPRANAAPDVYIPYSYDIKPRERKRSFNRLLMQLAKYYYPRDFPSDFATFLDWDTSKNA